MKDVKPMGCPDCGAGLACMTDDINITYWCVGKLKSGKRCYYSKSIKFEEENSIAPTQYQYIRYRSF